MALAASLAEALATTLLASLVALLMVSELLLINQIPDAEADRAIGRRHLVITLGPEKAAHLVAGLLLASYGVIVAGVISGHLDMTGLIALAPLPAAIWISLRLPRVLAMPDQLNRVLGANVAVLNTRLDFTTDYVNTMTAGAGKLTLADLNEEGANLLALQTRQQLGIQSLAFAGQSEQSILGLFR